MQPVGDWSVAVRPLFGWLRSGLGNGDELGDIAFSCGTFDSKFRTASGYDTSLPGWIAFRGRKRNADADRPAGRPDQGRVDGQVEEVALLHRELRCQVRRVPNADAECDDRADRAEQCGSQRLGQLINVLVG